MPWAQIVSGKRLGSPIFLPMVVKPLLTHFMLGIHREHFCPEWPLIPTLNKFFENYLFICSSPLLTSVTVPTQSWFPKLLTIIMVEIHLNSSWIYIFREMKQIGQSLLIWIPSCVGLGQSGIEVLVTLQSFHPFLKYETV